MAVLELKFLGGLSIYQDGLPFLEVKTRKGLVLLCYLAVTHKHCSRSVLAGLIWPDMSEANALMNLRKVLNRLKPLRHYLTITRDAVTFNWDTPCWLDVDEFLAAARQAYDIDRLQYAASLYQGDFLAGVSSEGATLFDEWSLEKRTDLQEIAMDALKKLVRAFADRQDYQAAITYQRQMLAIDPWHEAAHRQLMRLLALSGRRSTALRQFEICRNALAAELGVDPDQETVQLYEQIKAGQWMQDPQKEDPA